MVDVPFGTPFKSKADGKARYNNFEPVALDNRFEHCEDMAGMMMGPMPPDNFVDEFMQVDEELPPAPNVTFEDVPTNSEAKNEAEMYPWLVRTNSFVAVSVLTGCVSLGSRLPAMLSPIPMVCLCERQWH